MNDEKYMKKALIAAKTAYMLDEVPVGCVIVKDDTIIASGYNMRETMKNPLAHAEMQAIEHAAKKIGDWRLEGCTLYVTIEPCPMCAGAIVNARIPRVVFGAADTRAGYAGTVHNTLEDENLNHRAEVKAGVLEEECRTLIQSFFELKRKNRKRGEKE